jgi:hypothetical protein
MWAYGTLSNRRLLAAVYTSGWRSPTWPLNRRPDGKEGSGPPKPMRLVVRYDGCGSFSPAEPIYQRGP